MTAAGRFPAQLIAASTAEQPTAQDRIRCARVALRQALSAADADGARAWVEAALRQLEAA